MYEVIQSDLFHRDQSWNLVEIHKIGDRKVRTRIRRNAYDNQSWAVVELWTGTQWSQIVDRDIEFMSCKSTSYVHKREAVVQLFAEDAAMLRKMAQAVLSEAS